MKRIQAKKHKIGTYGIDKISLLVLMIKDLLFVILQLIFIKIVIKNVKRMKMEIKMKIKMKMKIIIIIIIIMIMIMIMIMKNDNEE